MHIAIRLGLLLGPTALAVAACGPEETPSGEWTLVAFASTGAGPTGGEEVTLQLGEDGAVSGKACNHYNGRAEVADHTIRFEPLQSTRMACPEPVMADERLYFQALERAERFRREGPVLELLDAQGSLLLRFQARS
jgi:putative lipoprotein